LRVDPTLCRSDRLVGQVLGSKGKLPPVYTELEINYFLLRRLLGVKATGEDKKQVKVQKLAKHEVLMVNIGSTSTGGKVLNVKAVCPFSMMLLTCRILQRFLLLSLLVRRLERRLRWVDGLTNIGDWSDGEELLEQLESLHYVFLCCRMGCRYFYIGERLWGL